MEGVMLGPIREDHPIWCTYPHLLLPAAISSSDHKKLGNTQSTNPSFFSSLAMCVLTGQGKRGTGPNGELPVGGTSCMKPFLGWNPFVGPKEWRQWCLHPAAGSDVSQLLRIPHSMCSPPLSASLPVSSQQ